MKEYNGVIKWFNIEKGYGFITCKDLNKDIFFHLEQLITTGFVIPKTREKVSFQLIETEKGIRAINIYI